MNKELLKKVENVFKDSTYCGWGVVLEELKQALTRPLDSELEEAKITLSQWKDDINECDYDTLHLLERLVDQALRLTPKINKEELKAEIIKESNEYFRSGFEDIDIDIDVIFIKNKNQFVLFRGSVVAHIASNTLYGLSITRKIPLSLASKIIKFFELGDE